MSRRSLNYGEPGRTRFKLAELLCKATGALFEAHEIVRNNPIDVHFIDCCSWDAWGKKTVNGRVVKVHVYSWDTMKQCIRRGIELLQHRGDHNDYEVHAKAERKSSAREKFAERFWSKVRMGQDEECWPWVGCVNERGYGSIRGPNQRLIKAHRMAWELTNGPIGEGLQVCHKCDNPPCCNPSHLFTGTAQNNSDDAVAKGRIAIGERNGMAKANEQTAATIRSMAATGTTSSQLAKVFPIDESTIRKIIRGEIWKSANAERKETK